MDESQKLRGPLVVALIVLAGVFVVGLRWVFTASPTTEGALFYLFDYAVGLTMIFLPCTLPLAFVIVPLAMGKGYARGLGIALSFGIGVATTLSIYGALLGFLGGQFIGQAETAKNVMYVIAGSLGLLFAFGDIGLLNFRMPTYSGAFPAFIQRQQEFLKAGLLGLFLGNIGVGCPNPLFNTVIVLEIFQRGSAAEGWLIMLIQALGRITPLFILAFLAIVGVNATGFLMRHREKVEHATGWAMVFVAGFLFSIGLFTHDWYIYSGIHTFLEGLTREELVTTLLGKQIGQLGHEHAVPSNTAGLEWGSYIMVTLWMLPFVWYWFKKRDELAGVPEAERPREKRATRNFGAFAVTLAILLYFTFGYFLPHRFLEHVDEHMMAAQPTFSADFRFYETPQVGQDAMLYITLKDADGQPLKNLQVEHERLVHAILISEDLQDFMHIHPEEIGPITDDMVAKAEFPVRVRFAKEGLYAIAVNFLHEGHEGVVRSKFVVGNVVAPVTIEKKVGLGAELVDDMEVQFAGVHEIRSGEEAHIIYTFIDNATGNHVTDLEGYLGAPMHLAIWSVDLGYFLHTHGEVAGFGHEVTSNDHFGPTISAHVNFPYPGLYKIFGQVSRGGKVYTTSFMVEVAQGANTNAMTDSHGAHGH